MQQGRATNPCARSRVLWRLLGLVVALCPIWASSQQVYRITDIGALDGATEMYDTDINESGQVTGIAYVNGVERAFLWDGNTLIDLGTLGGSGSTGEAINNTGQVTGSSKTAEDLETHAFLWDGNSMQDLGTLEVSSYALDINDAGQVVGTPQQLLEHACGMETACGTLARWGPHRAVRGLEVTRPDGAPRADRSSGGGRRD